MSSVALEHVRQRHGRGEAHAVVLHDEPGDAFAELPEDVLGHDELLHALVAPHAGVQVGERGLSGDAQDLDEACDHGVSGHRRQAEPTGTPFEPDEIGRLRYDGEHQLVVHPHAEVRRDAARDVAHAGGAGSPDDGARGIDDGRDDLGGVGRGVGRIREDDAHVLDHGECEGGFVPEDLGGAQQAGGIERVSGDVLVGQAPREVPGRGGRGAGGGQQRAMEHRRRHPSALEVGPGADTRRQPLAELPHAFARDASELATGRLERDAAVPVPAPLAHGDAGRATGFGALGDGGELGLERRGGGFHALRIHQASRRPTPVGRFVKVLRALPCVRRCSRAAS